MLVEIMQIATK